MSSARDTFSLDQPSVRAVDGQVGEAIGVLVAGAQRVTDGEAREVPEHALGLLVHRHEVGMLDPIDAEHLLHQELRVGDDLDFPGPFLMRDFERLEQARVFGDVVRRAAEGATDFNDVAGVGGDVNAVAGRAGIAPRRAVDECRELQDVGPT